MVYTLQLYDGEIASSYVSHVSGSQNTSESKKRTKKVLVVDDEPDVIITLKMGLEDTGLFEVYTFTNPEEALRDFKPGFYDFVLIDIKMSRMSGYELFDSIRKKDNKVKGCFITALEIDYDAIRKHFPTLERECYIKKPIAIDDLIKKINNELKGEN
ncbi:MAG: response regulator [Thermoproteota archaeon]|nr:response regulator [Thermoproteota archaeon]